jgi:ATP-binding cassette subfamily C protein CydC
MKNFWRLLKLSLQYKWWMALAALTGFFTIGSSIGLLMTSAWIITKAALHPNVAELQVAIVGVRFFGIARGAFRYAERLISHNITFKLLSKFRVWFYKSIEPLAPAGLSKYKKGDLLTRMVSDVESLEHVYIRVIFPPLVAIMVTILMWILFGIFNILFSIIITSALVFAGVVVPIFTTRLNKIIGKRFIEVRAKLKMLSVDLAQGLTELIVYGKDKDFAEEFNALNGEYNRLQRRISFIDGLNEGLIMLLLNATIIGILLVAIPQINLHNLTGVDLAVMIVGAMASFEAVLPIPTMAQHFESSMQAAERIFELTDTEPNIVNSEVPVRNVSGHTLEFKNVNFTYPGSKYPVLSEVSFELYPEKSIAVVGASGSGKTTLVNLIARFYDVQNGKIRLGGIPISQIDIEVLRKQFAVVLQSGHIFAGTLRDNLLIANQKATDAELIDALKKANIFETFFSNHSGLDTWVGESGHQISGGERQRLEIARAILKDAPILIFDEPTSNLDSENEKLILDTIMEISKNKSLLLITHRLVAMNKFDEIIVMRNGRIAEQGNEFDLINRKGYYYKMVNAQKQIIFE